MLGKPPPPAAPVPGLGGAANFLVLGVLWTYWPDDIREAAAMFVKVKHREVWTL